VLVLCRHLLGEFFEAGTEKIEPEAEGSLKGPDIKASGVSYSQ
jgi:hypothetical protein